MHALYASFFVLVAVVLPGCGGVADAPSLAGVSGKVLIDGQPQAGLTVEFHPDNNAGTTGPMSMGVTGEDGSFVLSTATGRNGAVIGTHRVAVKCPWSLEGRAGEGPATADGFGSSMDGSAPPPAPKDAGSDCTVNIKFEDPATSSLTAVVPEAGVDDLLLQATSK